MRNALVFLALTLSLGAVPASAASPTDWTLDFFERFDSEQQVDAYKAFIAAHADFRAGVKDLGDALRKESKQLQKSFSRLSEDGEKALLRWSKENEREWKRAVRERVRSR